MRRLILVFVLFVSLLTTVYSQHIRYVKPASSGRGDGSSWANASADIQAMMDSLKVTGGQVWVAKGTYKPLHKVTYTTSSSRPTTDRHKSFVLVKDVQLYGGFSGVAADTSLDQRDLHISETILSGDIGRTGDTTDNSYHVVVSAGDVGDACLDGFTITGGTANNVFDNCMVHGEPIINIYGGGIYICNSNPKLTNLIITDNKAAASFIYSSPVSYKASGGGIYIKNASPVLTDIVISHNSVFESSNILPCAFGGGMYNDNASPILTNVTIYNNKAFAGSNLSTPSSSGGGMYNNNSSPVLTDVTISHNTVSAYAHISSSWIKFSSSGGGIHNNNSSPILTDVTISHNTVSSISPYTSYPHAFGGGICNDNSFVVLSNVAIYDNEVLSLSSFISNTYSYGGGIYNKKTSAVLTNIIIFHNTASSSNTGVCSFGGGVYNADSSYITLTNVTIVQNKASSGGGIYNATSSTKFRNSILWGNTNNDGLTMDNIVEDLPMSYGNSLVEGISLGNGVVLNSNPFFVDVTNNDYRLQNISPCINAGNNAYYHPNNTPDISNVTTDLDGNDRINCIVDIGAYEYQGSILTKPIFNSPDQHICYGDTASILLDLEEIIPCMLIYTKDNNRTLDTIYSDTVMLYPLKVAPPDTTVYKIVQVRLGSCNIEFNDSIIVYVIPTAVLSNTFLSDTLCSGEQTKEVVFTGNGNRYTWELSGDTINGFPQGVQTGNFKEYLLKNTTENPQTAIVKITPLYIEDTLSCIGIADSFFITVLPEPVLRTVLENDTLCGGTQTKAISFSGATHYQWQNTGTPISGIPTGVQTGSFGNYKVENKTAYSQEANIRVTPQFKLGNKTCSGEADDFKVIVHPQTQIQSITCNKPIFCEDEQLELQVEATGGNLVYRWYRENNLLAETNNKYYIIPSVAREDKGMYHVEVIGKCGTEKSKSINIKVGSDKMLVEKWDDVILVDNSTNEYIGYQWYKDGIVIPDATNQFYQELGGLNGCYSVALTFTDGKKDRSCERCVEKVGKGFQAFPNPVKRGDKLQIVFSPEKKQTTGQIQIELYTIDGKKLWNKNIQQDLFEIETSGLSSGTYMIRAFTQSEVYNKTIIIYE